MKDTIYGEVKDDSLNVYLDRLKGRVFKILPMHEEECLTTFEYIESLNRELIGNCNVISSYGYEKNILELVSTIESIKGAKNIKEVKSDVFKSISIINRILDHLNKGEF